MSRRLPSTGPSRVGNRAPSMASGSASGGPSRLSRPASVAAGRRTTTTALGTVRVPSDIPETNINVVVRCRGRTPKEIEENSPPITRTGGPVSDTITINTTPTTNAGPSSIVAAADYTKTYKFDKVFGPEADQTTVFSEVADPMLDQVLEGYNCTIFAYGQTGTGKTFTMQGDVTPTPLMAPSIEAGIIPRVLHRLFARLDTQENSEYAVKCSYIEIYNEEMRDLLAYDYGKPGAGSNIKIFDDSSKKGVTVQGVEEAGVRDLNDGLGILRRGSNRRQVAETKMNTESSRSHSIFTLTVYVKETSGEKGGEDMLRIGKFNLVDLAGSEAVQRSGAEGKRQREAGLINQSLLSLGRVINCLVDKTSPHIPYRDSKLTRLLQDSLGGRTKTCIIATVSPTKSNMEETLSTLDYANRAKSIRNKPEVNAHLTKAGLLREYLGDIERLKAELHATREKNGVYIPDDQWKEMSDERAQRKLDYDEAKSRLVAIEVELKTRRGEFEHLTARFVTTTSELAEARDAERQLGTDLDAANRDVEAMRVALGDEVAIANAYAAGEDRLDAVAGELKSVVVDSVRDVGGLHAKIGRVASVLDSNTSSSHTFGDQMTALSHDLQARMSKLHTVQGDFGDALRSALEAYAVRGESESKSHMAELDQNLDALSALAQEISAAVDSDKGAFAAASAALTGLKDEVQSSVAAWARAMNSRSTKMVDELVAHQRAHLGTVGGVLDTTAALVDSVIASARENVAAQTASAERAHQLASKAADDEIARLRSQNAQLSRLLEDEKSRNKRQSADLVSNIVDLVTNFTNGQQASLTSAIACVQEDNESGVDDMESFAVAHGGVVTDLAGGAKSFGKDLEAKARVNDAQRSRGPAAMEEVTMGLRTRLEEYGAQTSAQVSERVSSVDGLCAKLGRGVNNLSASASSSADSHLSALSNITTTARSMHASSSAYTRTSADEVSQLTTTLLSSHATSSGASGKAHASAKRKLDTMLTATSAFISSLGADEPTGETPRKRAYEFPRAWERTAPRDELVAKIRRGSPLVPSAAARAVESRPLNADGDHEPELSESISTLSSYNVASPASEPSFDLPSLSSERREISRIPSTPSIASLRRPSSTTSLSSLRALPAERAATLDVPSMNVSTRRRVKKSNSAEYAPVPERPSVNVLGEGGNIPRKRKV